MHYRSTGRNWASLKKNNKKKAYDTLKILTKPKKNKITSIKDKISQAWCYGNSLFSNDRKMIKYGRHETQSRNFDHNGGSWRRLEEPLALSLFGLNFLFSCLWTSWKILFYSVSWTPFLNLDSHNLVYI